MKKSSKKKKQKKLKITCEILSPEFIAVKRRGTVKTQTERWNEIFSICSEIISENNNETEIIT